MNQVENIVEAKDAPSRARKIVEYGDILYSTVRPYLHNMCVIDRSFVKEPIASTGFAVLSCISGIYNSFLFYYLLSPTFDSYANDGDNAKGVAYPAINDQKFYKGIVPLPPLAEQKRIVAKIDELLRKVEEYGKAQEILDKLNEELPNRLRKSILQEAIQGKLVPQNPADEPASALLERIKEEKLRLVKEGKLKKKDIVDSVIYKGDDNRYFEKIGKEVTCIDEDIPFDIPKGWEWTRLSVVSDIYTGNSISETEKRTKYTEVAGRYYIGTKDVGFDNNIKYNNGVAIPKEYESKFRIAPDNSVLMCIEGGSAGRKIAVLNQDVCFGNKLCCFVPFVNMTRYIYYYLQSPLFLDMFNDNKTGIIGGVSIAKVKNILIPLPPYQEIERIVNKIDNVVAGIMSR